MEKGNTESHNGVTRMLSTVIRLYATVFHASCCRREMKAISSGTCSVVFKCFYFLPSYAVTVTHLCDLHSVYTVFVATSFKLHKRVRARVCNFIRKVILSNYKNSDCNVNSHFIKVTRNSDSFYTFYFILLFCLQKIS